MSRGRGGVSALVTLLTARRQMACLAMLRRSMRVSMCEHGVAHHAIAVGVAAL